MVGSVGLLDVAAVREPDANDIPAGEDVTGVEFHGTLGH
jgi:hypothetical protein